MDGCQELAKGETEGCCLKGTEFGFYMMKSFGDWLYNNMNILNFSELYICKWLRW